ncbi:MAG: hypothetical protein ACK417_00185 [Bacteroidia bacterium]
MRKVYLISLILLLSLAVEARKPGIPKNQLFVNYGLLDLSYMMQLIQVFQFTMDDVRLEGQPGQFNIEYRYRFDYVGVGGSLFARQFHYSFLNGQGQLHHSHNMRYMGLMAHVDVYWLQDPGFSFSSQIGVGIRQVQDNYRSDINPSYVHDIYKAAFQVTPIIMTFGNHNVHGRFDMGVGHRGFVAVGIGMQF